MVLESHKMVTKRSQNKHHKYTTEKDAKELQKSCKTYDKYTTKVRQKNVTNTLQKRDRMGGASNGKITC